MVDRNVRRPDMSARRLSGPRYRGAAPRRVLLVITSGGFRGGRAGPGLFLGDGLTPSLTVILANA